MRRWFLWVALVLAITTVAVVIASRYITRVPELSGDLAATRGQLKAVGLESVAFYAGENASAIPMDSEYVVEVTPQQGRFAFRGTTVSLLVDRNNGTAVVPNLLGRFEDDARETLTSAGLRWSLATRTDLALGIVYSQEPSAGTTVTAGTPVIYAAAFPHTPDSMLPEISDLHGLFYLRYGVEGSRECRECHSADTCTGPGCHSGERFEALGLGEVPE